MTGAMDVIHKPWPVVAPNMPDYAAARAAFTWTQARASLAGGESAHGFEHGAPGGRPARQELVRRHARPVLARQGRQVRDINYRELAELTSRFANAIDALGLVAGEHVFLLAGRLPALYIAAVLGVLKHRCIAAAAAANSPLPSMMTGTAAAWPAS
jgi:acetyl-CoA synthetase